MTGGNAERRLKNGERDPFTVRGPRFGIDKPAIPGPGRPRLPDSVKERRALLRKRLEEISVEAIELINQIVDDPKAQHRDRIRAAEIALSHALPRQEEVDLDATVNTFAHVEPTQLPGLLRHIDAEIIGREKDDPASHRAGT